MNITNFCAKLLAEGMPLPEVGNAGRECIPCCPLLCPEMQTVSGLLVLSFKLPIS